MSLWIQPKQRLLPDTEPKGAAYLTAAGFPAERRLETAQGGWTECDPWQVSRSAPENT